MAKRETEQIISEFHPVVSKMLGGVTSDCFCDLYESIEQLNKDGKLIDRPSDNDVTRNCKAVCRLLLIEFRCRYLDETSKFNR